MTMESPRSQPSNGDSMSALIASAIRLPTFAKRGRVLVDPALEVVLVDDVGVEAGLRPTTPLGLVQTTGARRPEDLDLTALLADAQHPGPEVAQRHHPEVVQQPAVLQPDVRPVRAPVVDQRPLPRRVGGVRGPGVEAALAAGALLV